MRYWYFWLLSLATIGFLIGKLIKHKSLYPFMPFRYDFRKRRDSFKKAMELLQKTNAKVLVETGTSREGLKGSKSNGAATLVFGKWAMLNNAFLHSVDISEESITGSQAEVDRQKLNNWVRIHRSDSVAFLGGFDEKVDFLYLDSYDYSTDPGVQLKSQQHHLSEFKAIERQLHRNTVVLIDDCGLPNGGKGKLVIEYMLENGWRIKMEGYQVLLLRHDFLM